MGHPVPVIGVLSYLHRMLSSLLNSSTIAFNKYKLVPRTKEGRFEHSNVDLEPVGSALIWVRGSGSRGIREKQEFKQQIFGGFVEN